MCETKSMQKSEVATQQNFLFNIQAGSHALNTLKPSLHILVDVDEYITIAGWPHKCGRGLLLRVYIYHTHQDDDICSWFTFPFPCQLPNSWRQDINSKQPSYWAFKSAITKFSFVIARFLDPNAAFAFSFGFGFGLQLQSYTYIFYR